MDDEFTEVDRSSLDQLLEIRRDQTELKLLMAKAEERRDTVDRSVYLRVRSDYDKRHAALEARAVPAVAALREGQAKLASRRENLRRALESVRLEKQEIEFRHALGELKAGELEKRLDAIRRILDERELSLQTTDELASDFEAALGPAIVPGPASKAPVAPREEDNDRTTFAPESDVPGPLPPVDGTDKTETVPIGRLVLEGSGTEHRLGSCTYIGRDPENHIRLQAPQVSRRHASVKYGLGGFVIHDEKSTYGTFVNDERIQEYALKDGDRVQVGEVRLVFLSR